MAETALLQQIAAFAGALWWTATWLTRRPAARWRFAVMSLSGALLWVLVAYTATNAQAADGAGGVVAFTSLPLAYFAAFMAVVSVVGTMLGLLLWTEEAVAATGEGVGGAAKSRLRGGD